MSDRWAMVGLCGAILLAAGFRLPWLGYWSLWADEAATAAFVALDWLELIDPLARLETTPPTYYVLMKAWTLAAGTSDMALRAVSALSGLASILLLWRLCRDAFGPGAAFWAAMTLAVAGWHVYYSREARVYALLGLALLLALLAARYLAARVAQVGAAWIGPALWLAVFAASAAWLHFVGTIAAATAYLYAAALILARGDLSGRTARRLITSAGVCGVLILPLLWLAWSLVSGDRGAGFGWMNHISLATAGATIQRVLLLAPSVLEPWPWAGPLAAGIAALLVVVLIWLAQRPGPDMAERAALSMTLLSATALLLIAHAIRPIVLTKTVVMLVPLVAALLGVGLARIGPRPVQVCVFLILLLSQSPALHDVLFIPPEGADARRLTTRIEAANRSDSVLITFDAFEATGLDRYRRESGRAVGIVLLPPGEVGLHGFVTQRLTAAQPVSRDTLLVTLCRDGRAPRLLVAERNNPVLLEQRSAFADALAGTGSYPESMIWDRSLGLSVWSSPACPPGARL